MSTSKGTSQYNNYNWEDSEFPIACETCMGENECLRMTREKYGRECGVCTRPYTVFRWQTKDDTFRYTEICQICARSKYVCQVCVMDLEYNVPVGIRNKMMGLENRETEATGPVNVEYHNQLVESQLGLSEGSENRMEKGKKPVNQLNIRMLTKLVKEETDSQGGILGGGDRPGICTFFMKGSCGRGETCPYRHESPDINVNEEGDLLKGLNSGPDIKARYYGLVDEDVLSKRVLERYSALPTLRNPDNKSLSTIKVTGLPHNMTEDEARAYLYRFGELRNVARSEILGEWVVEYTTRESAEKTAKLFFDWGQLGYNVSADWYDESKTAKSNSQSIEGKQFCFLPHNNNANKTRLLPPLPKPKNKRKGAEITTSYLKEPKILPTPQQFNEVSTKVIEQTEDTVIYPSEDPERLGNKKNF